MSEIEESEMGRIYIKVGSDIIDLTGSAKEVSDGWLKIKEDGSWTANLSAIRNARDLAVEEAAQRAIQSGIPERGSAFRRVLDSCGIEKTGDVILATIHYLRFVEKETNTPPRELKTLVSQSGKWGEEEVEKWNLSLYINRMLEGGASGKKQEPLLEYPTGMPKKNRYVVLTDAGRNYLERLSRV
jgi:hypothetical protein